MQPGRLGCPSCGANTVTGEPFEAAGPQAQPAGEPRRWEPDRAVASVERSSTRGSAAPGQRLLVGIGAVIAVALVAIAGMMFLDRQRAEGREAHGWGDLICHAKYRDPGDGFRWERDIDGDNVCRPEPW